MQNIWNTKKTPWDFLRSAIEKRGKIGKFDIGGPAGDRTQDLILKRDLLYQLSYRPVFHENIKTRKHENKIVFMFLCFYVFMAIIQADPPVSAP